MRKRPKRRCALAAVTVLEREMYQVGEAARLLALPVSTLRYWLDGDVKSGRTYEPVLREKPTGSNILTWGEFIEAGYLKEYRRKQRVSLSELRQYIAAWRDELGVPWPLAHQRPYVGSGGHLLDEAGTGEGDKIMYWFRDGQLVLTPWAEEFVQKVEFEHDTAQRYWPAGKEEHVVIDPRHSFGIPTVGNIRTEILYEMFLAGDPIEALADDYDISRELVEAAIRFESPRPRDHATAVAA